MSMADELSRFLKPMILCGVMCLTMPSSKRREERHSTGKNSTLCPVEELPEDESSETRAKRGKCLDKIPWKFSLKRFVLRMIVVSSTTWPTPWTTNTMCVISGKRSREEEKRRTPLLFSYVKTSYILSLSFQSAYVISILCSKLYIIYLPYFFYAIRTEESTFCILHFFNWFILLHFIECISYGSIVHVVRVGIQIRDTVSYRPKKKGQERRKIDTAGVELSFPIFFLYSTLQQVFLIKKNGSLSCHINAL